MQIDGHLAIERIRSATTVVESVNNIFASLGASAAIRVQLQQTYDEALKLLAAHYKDESKPSPWEGRPV